MTRPEPATERLDGRDTDVGSVFVSNYPPFSAWDRDRSDLAEEALSTVRCDDFDFRVYLHIPFCRKRCKFCYFRVYTDKNANESGSYLEALATEVEALSKRPAIAGRLPKFVYFGGGTPSYIGVEQLHSLVASMTGMLDGVSILTSDETVAVGMALIDQFRPSQPPPTPELAATSVTPEATPQLQPTRPAPTPPGTLP